MGSLTGASAEPSASAARKLTAAADPQLAVTVAEAKIDRSHGDEQGLGNLMVTRPTGGHLPPALDLAHLCGPERLEWRILTELCGRPASGLVSDASPVPTR